MYHLAVDDFNKKVGCKDKLLQCRELEAKLDPKKVGNVKDVNEACFAAMDFCDNTLSGLYLEEVDVRESLSLLYSVCADTQGCHRSRGMT